MDCSPPGSVHGDFPGKNTRVGCCAHLHGIFPTQGSNPDLISLHLKPKKRYNTLLDPLGFWKKHIPPLVVILSHLLSDQKHCKFLVVLRTREGSATRLALHTSFSASWAICSSRFSDAWNVSSRYNCCVEPWAEPNVESQHTTLGFGAKSICSLKMTAFLLRNGIWSANGPYKHWTLNMGQQVTTQPELLMMNMVLSDNRAIKLCMHSSTLSSNRSDIKVADQTPACPEDTSKIHKDVPKCLWSPIFFTLYSLFQFAPMASWGIPYDQLTEEQKILALFLHDMQAPLESQQL